MTVDKMKKQDIEKWIVTRYKLIALKYQESLHGPDKEKFKQLDKLLLLEEILIDLFGYTTEIDCPIFRLLRNNKVIYEYRF